MPWGLPAQRTRRLLEYPTCARGATATLAIGTSHEIGGRIPDEASEAWAARQAKAWQEACRAPVRWKPANCEGRGRRPCAGLPCSDAGLEARRRAPPRRAHRARRPRRAKGRQMELTFLRRRGPGLVPRVPRLHALRQGDVLPWQVAAPVAAGRIQAQGSALPRHLRG